MNLASTITPKSDQLNSDDLIAGPLTIKITGCKSGATPEQPVSIHYEGDNGRPYKPCKSMRRVLVALWGGESDAYAGRRLTLVRDADVRFGGELVGGIRISHASGIDSAVTLALTITRGKRKPYTVQPLPSEKPALDLAALEDIGATKAREGLDALTAWAATLSPAEKRTIGAERFGGWKLIATGTAEVK